MKPSRSLVRPLMWLGLLSAALTQVTVASAQTVADDGSSPGSVATIRAVRFHVEPGQTRVWLETAGAVLYTHYSPDPLTLVIDLPGVDISALPRRTVVGSREVESILATRLDGVNGRELSRVEIKLATIAPYQISGSEQALNIVFDGGELDDDEATDSSSPERLIAESRSSAPEPEPAPEVPASSPVVATDLALEPAAQPESDDTEEMTGEEDTGGEAATALEPDDVDLPSYPASVITGISHELSGDVLRVDVAADGRLNYSSFRLDGPKRLVFDFNGVVNEVPRAALTIDDLGVARVRVAQFRAANPRITRVVFDLDDEVEHRAVERRGGLRIAFSHSGDSLAALAAPKASFASLDASDDEPVPDPSQPLDDEPEAITFEPSAARNDDGFSVRGASLASEDGGTFGPVTVSAQQFSPPPSAPTLPAPPPDPPAAAAPGGQDPGSPRVVMPGGERLGQREYTGELITLDFKDGDIQDIFRLFADISGLNVVVQPGVSGRVTLSLTEVPWDQALELILKTHRLGYVVEGNVIRIAPLSELASEEAERRRLAEEQALAGELFTRTRVLSYARASEIQPLLQRNLSARGDIVIDERTNTVIYTDLAAQIQEINQLIDTLDTPIPGVEIEARIVVTTRTFSRQLGVQWGFTSNQTQFFGNTTELVFPNSAILDGQSIGSSSQRQFAAPGSEGGLTPPIFTEAGQNVQRGYAVNLPFAGAPTGAVGLSLGSITGAFNIDAALSAAERRGQIRIISAPKIITQNNKPAEIKQGVTFPVQVVANNTITVQFKDAVLDLNVTPQITAADTIILDIVVNNDSLDFGQQVQGIPSIVTQSATTQVLVADGSTTVIGGVFVNRQQMDEEFVPLLHRIPILGHLFKAKEVSTRNEELLIFLTPRIRKDTV